MEHCLRTYLAECSTRWNKAQERILRRIPTHGTKLKDVSCGTSLPRWPPSFPRHWQSCWAAAVRVSRFFSPAIRHEYDDLPFGRDRSTCGRESSKSRSSTLLIYLNESKPPNALKFILISHQKFIFTRTIYKYVLLLHHFSQEIPQR